MIDFNHLTWVHYTSATGILGFIGALITSKLAPGFLDAVGEKIFAGAWGWIKQTLFIPFFGLTKKKTRFSGYQIGGLVKTVQYLKKQEKENTKIIRSMKKEILNCTQERQNCSTSLAEARTQITDLYIWKKSIEKKINRKTA